MLHLYFMDHMPIILGDSPSSGLSDASSWLDSNFVSLAGGDAMHRSDTLVSCVAGMPNSVPGIHWHSPDFSTLTLLFFSVISVLRGDALRLWDYPGFYNYLGSNEFIRRAGKKLQESPLPFHHVSFINNNVGFGGWTQLVRHGGKDFPSTELSF